MKGKDKFSLAEIIELRCLIKERIKANRSLQKSIRAKMRRIGFYGSDDFGVVDTQPSYFENLIKSGRIKILGSTVEGPFIRPATPKIRTNNKPTSFSNEFKIFDPLTNDSAEIPDNAGNYIVCLRKGSALPEIGIDLTMNSFNNLKVIYTGIAGGSLRKRDYRQHFIGNNAGSSTLRKSLGSLFGYTKIPRDKDPNTGKTKFKEPDEIRLSNWMKSNLILFFKSNKDSLKLEDELIKGLNPPLNLCKNRNLVNSEFRKELSRLRNIK